MKTCYNGAGREVSVTGSTDNFVSSVAYAGAGVYGSDGGMTGLDVGAMTNKIKVTMEYNDHHRQLKALQAVVGGVLQWRVENRYCASGADGCAGNNGNIQQMLLNDGSVVRTQNFGYDEMNRLTVAVEAPAGTGLTGYQQNFGYTRNGNRWVAAGSTRPGGAYTANGESWYVAATNRYSTVDGWFGYDGGGNLVKEGIYGYTWDGENRMVQSTMDTGTAGTVTTGYVYDGDGRRVKRGGTVFVYDAFGKLAAEYGGTGPGNCRVCYMVSDHLGSVRVVFNGSGAVVKRSDYMPFGEEILSGVDWGNGRGTVYNPEPAGVRQKFTGKERDAETGLDWMKTRYFSGAQGRFTSPDKPFADQFPEDPQSWNLYTYVRNNPLKMRAGPIFWFEASSFYFLQR
mgnify:FL=1